jgi:glucose/arabinose dehydrogenase
MKKLFFAAGFVLVSMVYVFAGHGGGAASKAKKKAANALPDAALTLPAGFTATVLATGVDGARHIAVTKQGGIYVKLAWLKNGKGIWYLKDTKHSGTPDEQSGFANYPGTGMFIKDGYLYASSNSEVFRYALNEKGEVKNPGQPEKIITGLVDHDRDNAKAITLDNNDHIYVVVGSYTNACLTGKSLVGPSPCLVLDSAGGVWQFSTSKPNQTYKDGVHYATGLKNMVGINWNTKTGSLFVMQHNRDQLHDLFPQLYTAEQGGLVPAETMYELHKGSNAGWPYVYYDQFQHKKILAPEYGGDGKKTGGENAQDPIDYFPAHLAADGLLFYTGNSFPAKYKNGAFIAFHGKSPELKKGYLIAFVPFVNGKPSGKWEIFADGFAGPGYENATTAPKHKPCGLAQGPDGALYVADDMGGFIYRIQYTK